MTRSQDVREAWRSLPAVLQDLPLAIILLVLALVPAFQGYGTSIGTVPTRPLDLLGVLTVLLQTLPLAVRRTAPTLSLLLIAAGFTADQLLGVHSVAGIAFLIALVSAGAHLEHRRRATLVGLLLGYLAFASALELVGGGETWSGHLAFVLVLSAAWGFGAWLRATRAAEAERRRLIAERTVQVERARIARELHDVVTHHVTAMVIQAEAARYLAASPEKLERSLDAMADTGRLAVSDLRVLLDLLSPRDDPIPRGGLADLVETVQRSGQPTELHEEGPMTDDPDTEEVARRVVQEALTNALKHAPGAPTRVQACRGSQSIDLEVTTAAHEVSVGAPTQPPAPTGSGRGLVGLRHRVEERGGTFTAEAAQGGFTVRAHIPRKVPR